MNQIKGLMIVIAVLAAGLVWAAEPVDCVYRPKIGKAGRAGSVQEYKNCGTMVERKMVLSKRHLQRLHYDRYGLATVFVQGDFSSLPWPNGRSPAKFSVIVNVM